MIMFCQVFFQIKRKEISDETQKLRKLTLNTLSLKMEQIGVIYTFSKLKSLEPKYFQPWKISIFTISFYTIISLAFVIEKIWSSC